MMIVKPASLRISMDFLDRHWLLVSLTMALAALLSG